MTILTISCLYTVLDLILLLGHMTLYKNVLHNSNNTLPKWYLETLGVYVSSLNNCAYCVGIYKYNFAISSFSVLITVQYFPHLPDRLFYDTRSSLQLYCNLISLFINRLNPCCFQYSLPDYGLIPNTLPSYPLNSIISSILHQALTILCLPRDLPCLSFT